MFPGMDKRAMEAAMRKLGVQQRQVEAEEVIIRLKDGSEIVISNPSVTKVTMMGQENFQVSGEYSERAQQSKSQPMLFNDEDVRTVVGQSGCSEAGAKAALARVNGDLAAAILFINESK